MKRVTPASLAALIRPGKQSKLMDFPRSGLSSKLGSLEMHAEMNHGIGATHRVVNRHGIAQVAPHFRQSLVSSNAGKCRLAVEIEVENADLVPGVEQLRDEATSDVPCPPRDHDLSRFTIHYFGALLLEQ